MPITSSSYIDASGHMKTDTIAPAVAPSGSATTDDSLVVGDVVYTKSTGNIAKNTGATEAIGAGIVGIADGTYSSSATASYFVDGQLVTGLTSLTPGDELWAKHDGTLSAYSGVTSGKYTRAMGVVETATTFRVKIGDLIQKP